MMSKIKKYWWDLERFGLTPQKMLYRLTSQDAPKILCISVPKAGTHLLERVLCLHPHLYRPFVRTLNPDNISQYGGLTALFQRQRAGQILVSHLYFSEESRNLIARNGVKCLFLIRDPRDILVSNVFYIEKIHNHHLHGPLSKQPTFKEKLRFLIEGDSACGVPPFCEILEYFTGWLNTDCMTVRFEDLVQAFSETQKQTQLTTLKGIYHYLGINTSENWFSELSQRMISKASPTYRKGKTQEWKQYLDDDLKELFKVNGGEIVIKYGFEKDSDW